MRVSTTTLEAFRLFEQPDMYTDDGRPITRVSEAELVATIRGEFTPTHKISIGQAVGSVLEHPEKYRVAGGYEVRTRGGREEVIELSDDVMAEPLALIDRAHTVFEAKAIGRYLECDVVAKADQLCGAQLIETKATLASFDFVKFADSYQWRFMADLFEPAWITYRIFCLGESQRKGGVYLKSVESFNLFPYTNLRADCLALVERFTAFVRAKELDHYLVQRQREAA